MKRDGRSRTQTPFEEMRITGGSAQWPKVSSRIRSASFGMHRSWRIRSALRRAAEVMVFRAHALQQRHGPSAQAHAYAGAAGAALDQWQESDAYV